MFSYLQALLKGRQASSYAALNAGQVLTVVGTQVAQHCCPHCAGLQQCLQSACHSMVSSTRGTGSPIMLFACN